jgi:hypothetical protein
LIRPTKRFSKNFSVKFVFYSFFIYFTQSKFFLKTMTNLPTETELKAICSKLPYFYCPLCKNVYEKEDIAHIKKCWDQYCEKHNILSAIPLVAPLIASSPVKMEVEKRIIDLEDEKEAKKTKESNKE